MKKIVITSSIFIMLATSFSSFAISEAYRKQLDASGCTQLSDASGECNIHQSKSQNESEASKRSGPALPGPAAEVKADLDKKVSGKYLGQAVDAMTADGWTRSNQEGTKWEKAGFIASLNQDGNGQIKDVTVK